jgi:hypothetical protein
MKGYGPAGVRRPPVPAETRPMDVARVLPYYGWSRRWPVWPIPSKERLQWLPELTTRSAS